MMANILTTMLFALGTRGHLDVIVSLFAGNGNVIVYLGQIIVIVYRSTDVR
jgi:hypothetical protein